jgi:hypothetical protein
LAQQPLPLGKLWRLTSHGIPLVGKEKPVRAPQPNAVVSVRWLTDLHYRPDLRSYRVHQSGPRNLWNEIETAYHWWLNAGSPGPQRWRITVTPQDQQITLADTSAAANMAP